MKKILFFALFLILSSVVRAQVSIPLQNIRYNVNYHWGLIDVMIAHGVVTVETDGDTFKGTLDGTSIPWEGRIIVVSDTLHAVMTPQAKGYSKEKVTYQSGWYRHPKVSDFRSPNYNGADPANYKNIKGEGNYNASENSMEAITITSDMLGMYYYGHEFDFENMNVGDRIVMPIEGGYANEVAVTYKGKNIYKQNGITYPTYDVMFEYAYNGSLNGYEVECKYSANTRIPLFLSASLPVGHVEMLYIPD